MSNLEIGLLSFPALMALIFIRVPIGLAMFLVGLVGLGRRHVKKIDPLQDDAPLFKIRTTGDSGVYILQRKFAFGGLFVVTI